MRRMTFAYGRECSLPLVFIIMNKTKEISVFIDESGSFEPDEESSRFYLICLVFHDQSSSISTLVENLESFLDQAGLGRTHCVHVGPLIRREDEYAQYRREERQAIFRRMMAFVRKSDITYRCFKIDKHFNDSDCAIHDKLLQEMVRFLVGYSDVLNLYDKLKIYYDNGQSQVKDLLLEAFAMFSAKTEFVNSVKPENYRLFQAADLLCSIELAAAKMEQGGLSASESRFFGSARDFKRDILKQIRLKLAQA